MSWARLGKRAAEGLNLHFCSLHIQCVGCIAKAISEVYDNAISVAYQALIND